MLVPCDNTLLLFTIVLPAMLMSSATTQQHSSIVHCSLTCYADDLSDNTLLLFMAVLPAMLLNSVTTWQHSSIVHCCLTCYVDDLSNNTLLLFVAVLPAMLMISTTTLFYCSLLTYLLCWRSQQQHSSVRCSLTCSVVLCSLTCNVHDLGDNTLLLFTVILPAMLMISATTLFCCSL